MKKNKATKVLAENGGMSKANDHTPTHLTYKQNLNGSFNLIDGNTIIGATGFECDAKDIVRAVNAHEALLEAAKNLLKIAEQVEATGSLGAGRATLNYERVIIAQAENGGK